MKNLLMRTIFMIFLILGITTAFAGVTLVGGGAATTYDGWGSYYGYQRSAQIYTATEIGGYGTISSVGLMPTITKAAANVPIVVYMRTTTNTAEVAESWATKITGLTPLYSGTVASLTLQTWANVTLSAPFNYTTGNLEVLIESNYGGGGNSPYPQYYATATTGTNSAWYVRADGTAPTTVGSITTTRPNIRLNFTSFTASLATPTQAEYTAFGHQVTGTFLTPTLTWNAGNGNAPTGYKIYLGTDGSGTTLPTTIANGVDLLTATTYTPASNLAAGTAYYYAIVPYNGTGAAPYTPIWKLTTGTLLTTNVTGLLPATAAVNVSNVGGLSWSALTGATSYDVYFGTTMPGTPTAKVTTLYWIPPTQAYSTAYTWKVVGRNAVGASSGVATVLTYTTWADQTVNLGSASVTQNFDAAATMPIGWTAYKADATTTSTGLWVPSATYSVSTTRSIGFNYFTNGTQGVLISPPLTLPAEACRIKFQYRHSLSYPANADEKTQVYINSSPNLTGATLLTTAVCYAPATAWELITQALPVGAATGRYIIFKGLAMGGATQYIDDIIIEKIPQTPDAAVIGTPTSGQTLIGPSPTFTWTAPVVGAAPTGYKFYLGTTVAANELVNGIDLGNVLTYTFGTPLVAGTVHYWKVVPYNLVGDCSSSVNWSFTTANLVTAISTTPTPATAATLVSPAVTLGWTSVANATSYDVYFGTTLPGSPNANVVTPLTWSPGTMAYSTTYTWKIVPKNGYGATSGTPTEWTFTVGPDPLVTTFPFAESFDGTTFEPYGWTNVSSTGATFKWLRVTAGTSPTCATHSGLGMAEYNSYGSAAGNTAVLATPPLAIPADDYRLSFWMYADPGYPTDYDSVKVYLNTTATVGGTLLASIGRYNATAAWYQYVIPFGAGTAGTKYVVFNAVSAYGNNMFIDDLLVAQIPTAPLPAFVSSPAIGATSVALDATLNWTPDGFGPAPTGYKVYLGTDAAATNIVNGADLGLVTTYTPAAPFSMNGHYFWKIIPYNLVGDAVGCVAWDFYTVGIPGVVTTFTPANAATNVGRNVSLTWSAVPTATSYDVYFGATLPGTPNANVLSTAPLTWTPPMMYSLTVYSWKVVPKNSYGDAVSCPTWTFTTGIGLVYAASYATSAADDDIGQFTFGTFSNPVTAPTVFLNNPESICTYSDFTAMTINVEQDHVYPITIYQINSGKFYGCDFGIYVDFNQNGNFDLPAEQVFAGVSTVAGTAVTGNITIPSDATFGLTRLRVVQNESALTTPAGTYTWGETEDYTIYIQSIPPDYVYPAIVDLPVDLATNVDIMPTLTWHRNPLGGRPTGYLLSLGTDNPPTNIQYEKDLGNVTTFTPEIGDFAYNTHYYWQIIPYNAYGYATGCPVWQFDTMPDPTINTFPRTETFEEVTPPALPALWTTENLNGDTVNWVTVASGGNNGPKAIRIGYNPSLALNDWFYSAPVTMVAGGRYAVSFSYKTSGSYPENLSVSVGTSASSAGMTNVLWTGEGISNSTYTTRIVNYFAPVSGNYYFGWHAYSSADMYYILVDDIVFNFVTDEPPFFLDKDQLGLPAIPLGGAASDFFTISSWYGSCSGTISYSSGLTGPTTFTAVPDSVIEVTCQPTVQGFYSETVTVSASGYSRSVTVSGNAGITAVDWEIGAVGWSVYNLDANANTWGLYTNSAHSGTMSVGVYFNPAGNNDWLVSPQYLIQAGDVLSFYAKSMDADYPEALKVWISATGNTPADFTTSLLDIPVVASVYTGYSVDLSAYAGQSVWFAFQDYSVNSWYLMLDDIGLPALVIPNQPTNLVTSLIGTQVQLSWTAVPHATSYRVYTSPDPYAPAELWSLLAEEYSNSYTDTVTAGKKFYKVTTVNGSRIGNHTNALKLQKIEPISAKPSSGKRK